MMKHGIAAPRPLRQHLSALSCTLFGAFLALTLATLLLVPRTIAQHYPSTLMETPNILLIAWSVLLLTGAAALCRRADRAQRYRMQDARERSFRLLLCAGFALMFVLQRVLADHIYFRTGWDVATMHDHAMQLARGARTDLNDWYYNTYPNNVTLTHLLAALYRLGDRLGAPEQLLLIFTNAAVGGSVVLAVLCVYRLTRSRFAACFALAAGTVLIALSPWEIIPYSDALMMPFPVLMLFCDLYIHPRWVRYPLMTLLAVAGYYIKPTAMIPLIALALLRAVPAAADVLRRRIPLHRAAAVLLLAALAAGGAAGARNLLIGPDRARFSDPAHFTATHYLMMGLNDTTDGVYSHDDVDYSCNFSDVASRQQGEWAEFVRRLGELGVGGVLKLWTKKNLANYNDGTFAWLREGGFFSVVPQDGRKLTQTLRRAYYWDAQYYTGASRYQTFCMVEQTVWLMVLLGGVCACFGRLRTRRAVGALALSLFGVSLFLLIFECRARYLYPFSPLYLVLAAVGVHSLAHRGERDLDEEDE